MILSCGDNFFVLRYCLQKLYFIMVVILSFVKHFATRNNHQEVFLVWVFLEVVLMNLDYNHFKSFLMKHKQVSLPLEAHPSLNVFRNQVKE